MAQYVKLGEKAQGFYSIALDLTIDKGQVVELTKKMRADKAVDRALKGGHLQFASEEEFKKYQASDLAKALEGDKPKPGKAAKPPKKEKEEEDEEGNDGEGEEGEEDDDELTVDMVPTTGGKKAIIEFLEKHFDDLDPKMGEMKEQALREYAIKLIEA